MVTGTGHAFSNRTRLYEILGIFENFYFGDYLSKLVS